MCNDCGCQENVHSNQCCNIVECGSISVTQEWNDTIVCAPNIEVTSPDNSISVNKVTSGNDITFEIEKDCCPDNAVGACPSDTNPWHLFNNKLRVDTTGPLTYDLVNCPWDGYVKIGFDVDNLNAPDKMVAVDATCPGKYLSDALISINPYFSFEKSMSGCEYVLTPLPKKLLRAEMYNNRQVWVDIDPDVDGIYGMPISHQTHNINIPSAVSTYTANGITSRAIIIPRDGWYQINMQGSYVLSWVHTLRNQICYANDLTPILDSREEGGWRVDEDANNSINTQNELNTDISKKYNEDIISASGKEMSISTFMRGHGFAGSTATYLTAGTKLVMLHKFNTRTKNNFTSGFENSIVFTGRSFDTSTNGDWAGTWRSIVELPEYTLSN